MAVVIQFRSRESMEEDAEIDLLTAVDVAIRDLRDISHRWDESSRALAVECRAMLEKAFATALRDGY